MMMNLTADILGRFGKAKANNELYQIKFGMQLGQFILMLKQNYANNLNPSLFEMKDAIRQFVSQNSSFFLGDSLGKNNDILKDMIEDERMLDMFLSTLNGIINSLLSIDSTNYSCKLTSSAYYILFEAFRQLNSILIDQIHEHVSSELPKGLGIMNKLFLKTQNSVYLYVMRVGHTLLSFIIGCFDRAKLI